MTVLFVKDKTKILVGDSLSRIFFTVLTTVVDLPVPGAANTAIIFF
jgi:hypothetical protein